MFKVMVALLLLTYNYLLYEYLGQIKAILIGNFCNRTI